MGMTLIETFKELVDKELFQKKAENVYKFLKNGKAVAEVKVSHGHGIENTELERYKYSYTLPDEYKIKLQPQYTSGPPDFKHTIFNYRTAIEIPHIMIHGDKIPLMDSLLKGPIYNKFKKFKIELHVMDHNMIVYCDKK